MKKFKKLCKDTKGENLIGVVIFTVTLLAISALLVGNLSVMFQESEDIGILNIPSNYEILGGEPYLFWNPFDGFKVTDNDVLPWCKGGWTTEFIFYSYGGAVGDFNRTTAYVVRDNTHYNPDVDPRRLTGMGIGSNEVDYYAEIYEDFIYLAQKYWAGIAFFERHAVSFPFDTIIRNQISGTNYSTLDYRFGDNSYTLIIRTPLSNPSWFDEYLYNNDFTMFLGINQSPTIDDASLWVIVGQILTGNLPDMQPTIGYIIAIPLWAAISFTTMTLIGRFLPFISGEG